MKLRALFSLFSTIILTVQTSAKEVQSSLNKPGIENCMSSHFEMLNGNKVEKCDMCFDGYCPETDYSSCEIAPYGCKICNNGGDCKACFPGRYLNGTNCKPCREGCALCTKDDDCLACIDPKQFPYNLNGDVHCRNCSKGCATCEQNIMSFSCLECEAGYSRTLKSGFNGTSRYYCQKGFSESVGSRKSMLFGGFLLVLASLFICLIWIFAKRGAGKLTVPIYEKENEGSIISELGEDHEDKQKLKEYAKPMNLKDITGSKLE